MNDATKTCTTCCKPVYAPFRRIVDGKCVAGCVAKDHDGHLYGESLAWHNRPVAKQYRREHAKWIQSITK